MGERPVMDSNQRLSDTQLEKLERDSLSPFRLTNCVTMWLRSAVTELREHRASSLSDADVEALRLTRHIVARHSSCSNPFDEEILSTPREKTERALAVLDRLLDGAKGREP